MWRLRGRVKVSAESQPPPQVPSAPSLEDGYIIEPPQWGALRSGERGTHQPPPPEGNRAMSLGDMMLGIAVPHEPVTPSAPPPPPGPPPVHAQGEGERGGDPALAKPPRSRLTGEEGEEGAGGSERPPKPPRSTQPHPPPKPSRKRGAPDEPEPEPELRGRGGRGGEVVRMYGDMMSEALQGDQAVLAKQLRSQYLPDWVPNPPGYTADSRPGSASSQPSSANILGRPSSATSGRPSSATSQGSSFGSHAGGYSFGFAARPGSAASQRPPSATSDTTTTRTTTTTDTSLQ